MEIVKTICPRCFKIFSIPYDDEVDKVTCSFCEHIYEFPKFGPGDNTAGRNYWERNYNYSDQ